MKSLLFGGTLPFSHPPGCEPGRMEVPITIRRHGRLYKMILRDKICIEDPYLVLVKASAFAIREEEPFAGTAPDRSVRDFLIKSSLVI